VNEQTDNKTNGETAQETSLLSWFKASRVSVERLSSDVEAFETRLQPRLRRAENQEWAKTLRSYLRNAHEAIETRSIGAGYESLLAAERAAVPGLTPAERRARLASLREEASRKLVDSWRGIACEKLLGDGTTPVSSAAMQEAMFHVHTRSQNAYHKLDLLRQQLRILAVILTLLVVGTLLLARIGALDFAVKNAEVLLPMAVLFGLLGGALSSMITVKGTPPALKIPDAQRSAVVAYVRVLIGGAAAIPIYILIEGQLINIVLGEARSAGLMAFCFLGGFSERWFLGRIESLAGKRVEEADGAAEEAAIEATGKLFARAAEKRELTYRAGAGVVLCRDDGKVVVGRRIDAEGDTWQFPQGGIEAGETALEAATRELHEELGVAPDAVELVHAAREPVSYELPPAYRNARVGLGQTQRWFLFRLKDKSVFEITPVSEFSKLQWVSLEDVAGLADDFRQPVYARVAEDFLPRLPGAKTATGGSSARTRTTARTTTRTSTKKKTATASRTSTRKKTTARKA
jgi:putative (di)nucleoside polyphosphate hydrolase